MSYATLQGLRDACTAAAYAVAVLCVREACIAAAQVSIFCEEFI